MENVPYPTRAEADNITAAIILWADYVMTSEETAMWKFPAETVEAMVQIIEYTENNLDVLPLENLNKIVRY
jgi:pyruvate kinase